MPKRKKRRQNDSSRAMQQALDHYECALRNLEDADERAALEALDFAEVFLERAQDDDVRQGLVAEVSLARGASSQCTACNAFVSASLEKVRS